MRNSFLILLLLPFIFSCGISREMAYFEEVSDSEVFSKLNVPAHVVQEDDILDVTINSINDEASAMFNSQRTEAQRTTSTGDVLAPTGYQVNNAGEIEILLLGNIQVAGLTTKQVQEKIQNLLIESQLLLNPVVKVRLMNFKVTVLGEVNRPTVVTVPEEKITLLEALGVAGDLTMYGKRRNVLLIREEGGKRVTYRINLNSKELFSSPFYYLKSNDVLYVEPTNTKVASSTLFYQILPTIISGLSIAIIVFDRFR